MLLSKFNFNLIHFEEIDANVNNIFLLKVKEIKSSDNKIAN